MKRGNDRNNERGYVLVGVMFLLALALIISSNMLELTASFTKTRSVVNKGTDYYYDVEQVLGNVVGWMQDHSQDMVSIFRTADFNSNFVMGSPSAGSNEPSYFSVDTMVKDSTGRKSIILASNSNFGDSYFPATTNISTGAAFDAVASFQNADLGPADSRLTLVWARSTADGKEPIFRIDVATDREPERGVRAFALVGTQLVTTLPTIALNDGFYGLNSFDTQTGNNTCVSNAWTCTSPGVTSAGADRANCMVGSNGNITISSNISGDVTTNVSDGLTLAKSGNISGSICTAPGCNTTSDPGALDVATFCKTMTSSGDLNITTNTTLTAVGGLSAGGDSAGDGGKGALGSIVIGGGVAPAPTATPVPTASGNCYGTVTVNNATLTLSTTNDVGAYWINYLNLQGSGKIAFAPVACDKKIEVHVDQLNSNWKANGNQVYNATNAPHQVLFYMMGSSAFQLNGTADFRMFFVAPNSDLTMNGNFLFYGGAYAQSIAMSGRAKAFADESTPEIFSSTPVISDMKITLLKAAQRYR